MPLHQFNVKHRYLIAFKRCVLKCFHSPRKHAYRRVTFILTSFWIYLYEIATNRNSTCAELMRKHSSSVVLKSKLVHRLYWTRRVFEVRLKFSPHDLICKNFQWSIHKRAFISNQTSLMILGSIHFLANSSRIQHVWPLCHGESGLYRNQSTKAPDGIKGRLRWLLKWIGETWLVEYRNEIIINLF